jgi:hypothetical protein
MFVNAKHIPDTEEFMGTVPQWMIQGAGGTSEAADALYQYAYASDEGSFGTRQVIRYAQELLRQIGFEVPVSGHVTEPTIAALQTRMGPTWELHRWKDIIWELQVGVDRGDRFSLGETEEQKPKKLFSWPVALLVLGAVYLVSR